MEDNSRVEGTQSDNWDNCDPTNDASALGPVANTLNNLPDKYK